MTISSMTGYAIQTRDTLAGTITIELKSVNSRFLDLQFRINDELRMVEPMLREAISSRIVRGKVECRLSFGRKPNTGESYKINPSIFAEILKMQDEVHRHLPSAAPMSINELLRWPGMIEEAAINQETLLEEVMQTATAALALFVESRAREGNALQNVLLAKITEMEAIVGQIAPLIPQVIAQFQQKAIDRMQEAFASALQNGNLTDAGLSRDEVNERIRQEVTLYGMKIDVAEELARLTAHLAETRQILQKGGQLGKRLDFMMQELNREANTIGSKAPIKELSDASMALKLLIEQMREQVQNLE